MATAMVTAIATAIATAGTNPSLDIAGKVSGDASETFIKAFYHALDSKRETISTFYALIYPNPSNPTQTIQPCDISINGNVIPTPQAVQRLFIERMPESRHEVQSFDCHPLNPNCNLGVPEGPRMAPQTDGSKMSLLVMVSGYVEYEGSNAPRKGFSESFVLIPNVNAKGKGDKMWLILSQQFRMV